MTINLEKSLELDAPVQEVFDQWADIAAYARFMPGVLNVKPTQENQWIWETEGQPWQVEITQQSPLESISWRISTPDVTGTATVRFTDLDGARTKVVYTAHYPNGVGPQHSIATVAEEMEQALERFARVLGGEAYAPPPDIEADASGEDADVDAEVDAGTQDTPAITAVSAPVLDHPLNSATQAFSTSMVKAFESFSSLIWNPVKALALAPAQAARTWSPRFEVSRGEGVLFVSSQLPGYEPDDLHVEIRDGQLLVSGERQAPGSSDGSQATSQGKERFQERMPLTLPIDSRQVEAQLTPDGELRITLPLKPEAQTA